MHPDLRAAIRRDGVVRAVRWAPHLEICGALATLLDERERAGVTIADLTLVREDEGTPITEVIAEFLCGGDDAARDALTSWAALVGMTRIWLPGEVRDIEPIPPGKLETRCSACHLRLVDGGAAFWAWVGDAGHFPGACPLCGADLPQWRPVRPRRRRARLELVEALAADDPDVRVSDRRGSGRP